jgi:hypothetical protein
MLLGLATLLLGACGGDDPGGGGAIESCQRDLARIAARERCLQDDHCPCGAHCTLGRCEADCLVNAQCGAGRCDAFGRCRQAADPDSLPQLVPRVVGELATSPLSLESSDGQPQELRILAGRQTLPRVRLVADPGLLVRCDEADTFRSECELGPVYPGAARAVKVVENAPLPPGEARLVRLYAGAAMHQVSYSAPASREAMFSRKSLDATVLAGSYSGRALARTTEISADAEEGFYPQALESAPPLAVTASVYLAPGETTGVLVLTEPFGTFGPGGDWIGAIALEETSGSVRFPTLRLLDGPLTATDAVEVLMEGEAGLGWSLGASTTLSLTLTTRLRGLLPGGLAARTRWVIDLRRDGALPADAPPPVVPADALPALDPSRASTSLSWEDAALRTLPDVAADWTGVPAGVVDTFRLQHPSPPYLEACREAPVIHEAAARTFFLEHLNAGAGTRAVDDIQSTLLTDPSPLVAHVASAVPAFTGNLAITVTTHLTPGPWPVAAAPATTIDRAIPCEVTLVAPPNVLGLWTSKPHLCGDSVTFSLAEATVDRCAAMTAALGCEPVAVDDLAAAGSFSMDVGIQGTGSFTAGARSCKWTGPSALRVTGRVTRVCRLPRVPARCVDAALCVQPGSGSDHASLPTSNLGPEVAHVSGDSLCTDTARGAALPVDENADRSVTDPTRLAAEALLGACLGDLEAIRTAAPAQPAAGSGGAGLSLVLGDAARCLDPGRFFLALGLATDDARSQLLGPAGPNGERAGAQAHRLIQRHVQLLGFQAREVLEQEQLGQVIRALGDASLPDPSSVLLDSLAGWNLLLHPRFAAALAALPGAVLAAPDYRPRLGVGTPPVQAHHEQYDSLAIAMQETLRTQMELAEVLVQRAARAGDRSVLSTVGVLLRTRQAIVPLVKDLVARAVAHAEATSAPAPAWLMRYERARGAAEAAGSRLLAAADALQSGRNPLGIEDSDLPLYFYGTPPGAGDRFFAISDYLLGDGPGSMAWAPAQVEVAQDALQAARTAWLAQRDRALDVVLEIDARATREAAIARAAGDQLLELCGDHRWPDLSADDLLDQTPALNVDTCFFKNGVACQVSQRDYSQLWKKADVQRQLCQAGLRATTSTKVSGLSTDWTSTGVETAHPGVSDFDWMLMTRVKLGDDLEPKDPPKLVCTGGQLEPCNDGTGRQCFTCSIEKYHLRYRSLSRTDFRRFFPDQSDSEFWNGSKYIKEAKLKLPLDIGTLRVTSSGASGKESLSESADRCKRSYGGRSTPPTLDELSANPANVPSCYAGSLGELALSVQASVKAAEKARAELGTYTESYDIAMRSCIRLQQGNDFIQRATLEHDAHMSRMRAFKLGFDVVARVARGVKETQDLATAGASGAVETAGASVATAAVGAAAAQVEAAADVVSLSLQMAMDQSEQDHERVVAEMQMNTELDRCVIEAELHLVGARAAALNFQTAIIDIERAAVELQNAKDRTRRTFDQGQADLAQARTSPLRRSANDFWLDEAVSTFTREMHLARRVSYLAVRAVEYEVQQSLAARGDVLEAEIPDDLDTVIDDLMTITGTRQLNGAMPSGLKSVVSLRRHLLQLADRSGAPAGDLPLTEVQRFRLLLMDVRYQTLDDNGVYLGQLIPFHLAPLGTLGLGGQVGAYVFAANDCAERVWSVNASLHGEEGLFEGDDPSFVRIDLLKRNTFYSQWCIPPAGGAEPFQVASVRPTRNLFREPGLGPVPGTRSVAETDEYTRARIEAYFNVPRDEFEQDAYANGDTSELAGRGLYGDYALFIPAGILSTLGEDGVPTGGLRLDRLTDILIRLDYVSVARN